MTLRAVIGMKFADIDPGGADMPRPLYSEADPTKLFVDETYQRNLSERSRSLIRRLVANWDWRAFKPPVVVETEDGYHVIDGQHTAIAAASHPLVGSIPIQIVEAPEISARAQSFVKLNRDRIAISPGQMHFAMVAAGDEDALTIEAVCQRANVQLLKNPPGDGYYREGDCVAISTLRSVVARRHAMGARRVLDVCRAAKLSPISAAAIRAVEFLLFEPEYQGTLDVDDLATTLRDSDSERQGKIHAIEHRVPLWRGLAITLYRNTKKSRHGRRASA